MQLDIGQLQASNVQLRADVTQLGLDMRADMVQLRADLQIILKTFKEREVLT